MFTAILHIAPKAVNKGLHAREKVKLREFKFPE